MSYFITLIDEMVLGKLLTLKIAKHFNNNNSMHKPWLKIKFILLISGAYIRSLQPFISNGT